MHSPSIMAGRSPPVNQEISRSEIQAAFAKAAELRALHAALVQGTSPGILKPPHTCASPTGSRHSAQDYPVFTPTYEEEYHQNGLDPRRKSINWDEDEAESTGTEKGSPLINLRRPPLFKRGFAGTANQSPTGIRTPVGSLQNQPSRPHAEKKRSLDDTESSVTCNRCNPVLLSNNSEEVSETTQKEKPSNGLLKSWLFSRTKRKGSKTQPSPNRTERGSYIYQSMDEWVAVVEALKKKLAQANENKDAAVSEVRSLRSSMEELEKKLKGLELYCQDLKQALNQNVQEDNDTAKSDKTGSLKDNEKLILCKKKNRMGKQVQLPVGPEAMVEGFLQIVSEARVSVKQLCRTLVSQMQDLEGKVTERLNSLLQPYNLSINSSKVSRGVMYHLEALMNEVLYQDFENCSFQRNGAESVLGLQERCQENFACFASLRNLSWSEVLRKGTRYYSESFGTFCDQKMSLVVSMINWARAWPEPLLQAFFIAAKCIWLVHLLAFSFNPPLGIFRVEKGSNFDAVYMEDILTERHTRQVPCKVRIMVMPGFYVHDDVLRCKVLCRYKNGS